MTTYQLLFRQYFKRSCFSGESDDVMRTLEVDTTQIVSPGPEMSCQEKLSSDVSAMGNTKSFSNTDKQNSQEILIDTVNENIKRVCSSPEYKSNEKCQLIIQKVLNVVVDATNEKELCENMKNQNLQDFIIPLKESDIKQLCQNSSAEQQSDANIGIIPSEPVLQEASNNNTTSEQTPNKKLRSVVTENVRILKKSPSYSHDQISQMSVKLVSEILEKANTEVEITKSLKQYNLGYFSREDKTEFWSDREESMSRLIMETLEEDEEQDESAEEDLCKNAVKELHKEDTPILASKKTCDFDSNLECMESQDEVTVEPSKEAVNESCQAAVDSVKPMEHTVEQSIAQKDAVSDSSVLPINVGDIPSVEAKALDTVTRSRPKMNKGRRPQTRAGRKKVEEIPLFSTVVSIGKEDLADDGTNPSIITSLVDTSNVVKEFCVNLEIPLDEKVETERSNLITIINKNISKICKEEDYNRNETSQRKVRTLFNIITESKTAEEIYDQIELEGLQYFAELESVGQSSSPMIETPEEMVAMQKSTSPPVIEKPEEDKSIVSKILSEINTPKLQRRELEKSRTAGDIHPKKEVTICTITRNKASRRVKKFKTSKSTTSLDKIGISSDSNSRSSESDAHSSAEILKTRSKSPSVQPCPLPEIIPSLELTGELNDRLTPKTDNDDDKEQSTEQTLQASLTSGQSPQPCQISDHPKQSSKIPEQSSPPDQMSELQRQSGQMSDQPPQPGLISDQPTQPGLISEQPAQPGQRTEQPCQPGQISDKSSNEANPEKTETGCEKTEKESNIKEPIKNKSIKTKSLSFSLDEEEKSEERESVDLSLTPEVIERKQQSAKAQKNFSEALRENKHRREKKKKQTHIDENSIVSRILGEKRKSETKEPTMPDKKEEEKMPNETRREKTISECSDNLPDLCPIEGDETPEADFIDENDPEFAERSFDFEVNEEELPCNLSKRKSSSLFFMTDLDDEEDAEDTKSDASEDESFTDANEHLSHDETVKIIPLIKEVLTSTLKEGFSNTQDNDLNIDKISANLLSPLTTLVKAIVDEKLTAGSSKGHSPLFTPDVNSENQCLVSTSETEKEVEATRVEEEREIDGDAFDESMKRLEFIESSFKTIISEETTSVPAIQHTQDQNQVEDRLERIKLIMASTMEQEEKLRQIDSILKEGTTIE